MPEEEDYPEEDNELPTEEELIDNIWADLANRRHQLAEELEDGDDQEVHFTVRVLGGKWTHENRGRVYDAFQGFARTVAARNFCSRFELPLTKRYAVSLWGDGGAQLMARTYVEKMKTLFQPYYASGDEHFVFAALPVHVDFSGPFMELHNALNGERNQQRTWELINLQPTNPP